MKQIQFDKLGGPEVLKLVEVPIPEVGPETVLVRNRAAGINCADTLLRRGQYVTRPNLPDTPGLEAAGVIEKVGEGVTDPRPGMRVAARGQKTYSEYSVFHQRLVTPLPEFMSFEQGAAFPIQVLTAWHILHTSDDTRPGMIVVVHSAAGGVGIIAVQIAKAAGATVIGTVSKDPKAELVRQYGADHVINYETHDFDAEVMKISDGKGAILILDALGKPTFQKGLDCLAPLGHLVLYGRAGGPPDPLNVFKLLDKSTKVSAFFLSQRHTGDERWNRGIEESFRLIKEGKVKLLIGGKFPLADAPEAHRFMESRGSTGKLVLTM